MDGSTEVRQEETISTESLAVSGDSVAKLRPLTRKEVALRGAILRVLMALNRDGADARIPTDEFAEPLIRCYIGRRCYEIRVTDAARRHADAR